MVNGPYARIAVLRPHDGDTVDFEASYTRHLEWHRQANDQWSWFGWTVWAGERQRWLIYATFGHSSSELDNPVDPAGDERDNILNVIRHGAFLGHALLEFLPAISRGTGEPSAVARVELTTVDVQIGRERAFEAALKSAHPSLHSETLWYRMLAGGSSPRYVRLRPHASLTSLLDATSEQPLPDDAHALVKALTTEILTLRPAMSYNLPEKNA